MKVLIIHGPNLNLLGMREPHVYGSSTLGQINAMITERATLLGVQPSIVQHNSESGIIEAIHECVKWADALIINPAAYTHYSIAIRDAISAVGIRCVEVHLTNIYRREQFRQHSVVSGVAEAVISGLGAFGYLCALEYLASKAHVSD
jgi:3-dehydroquinate dehydratase-2